MTVEKVSVEVRCHRSHFSKRKCQNSKLIIEPKIVKLIHKKGAILELPAAVGSALFSGISTIVFSPFPVPGSYFRLRSRPRHPVDHILPHSFQHYISLYLALAISPPLSRLTSDLSICSTEEPKFSLRPRPRMGQRTMRPAPSSDASALTNHATKSMTTLIGPKKTANDYGIPKGRYVK